MSSLPRLSLDQEKELLSTEAWQLHDLAVKVRPHGQEVLGQLLWLRPGEIELLEDGLFKRAQVFCIGRRRRASHSCKRCCGGFEPARGGTQLTTATQLLRLSLSTI